MIAKRILGVAAAAAVLASGGHALADTFDISLTGQVANFSFSSQDCCGAHFDQAFLSLDGLNADNAFTVHNGDTVNAAITLDQDLTIPASVTRTNVGFFLFGSAFPNIDTGVGGALTFFEGMTQVAQLGGGTGTHGALALALDFFPPDNGPLTFNNFTADFTINNLSQAATLDSAGMDYSLVRDVAAVPEPATWALMLIGFGGLGAMLRARRQRSFA
ncbi:MAG: PEPxxWA-CTERM sorting domain-containing protein [Phenylobacterium sp.]